ncbi:MAG: hypothetical protein AAB345_00130 [Patescibacteria group bacterium]
MANETFGGAPAAESGESIAGIFDRYRNGERFDFSKLPPGELGAAVDYYREHISEIDPTGQVEILEQFLQLKAAPEEQFLEIAKTFSWEQKIELGNFVGGQTEPGLYAKIFHRCFKDAFHQEEVSVWCDKFLRGEGVTAKHVLMVAPFLNLSELVTDSETLEKKEPRFSERKKFVSAYHIFKPGESGRAIYLLDALFDNLPAAQELMDDCLLLEDPDLPGLESALNYFTRRRRAFVLRYLPQLMKIGAMDEGKAVEILTRDLSDADQRPYFTQEFYSSDETKKEYKNLVDAARQSEKLKKEDYFDELSGPRRIAKKLQDVRAVAESAGLDFALENWDQLEKILPADKRNAFLRSLVHEQVPILKAARRLKLTSEEIRTLFSQSMDEEGFKILDDASDLKHLVDIGKEQDAVWIIRESILRNTGSFANSYLVDRLDGVLSWFSEVNQREILKVVESEPDLFANRWDWILTNRPGELKNFIHSAVRQSGGYGFQNGYQRVLQLLNEREAAGSANPLTPDQFREFSKDLFEKYPPLFLRAVKVFSELYNPDEQKEFFQKNVSGLSGSEIINSIINSHQPNQLKQLIALLGKDGVYGPIGRAVREDPDKFVKLMNESGWRAINQLEPVFKVGERLDLFLEQLPKFDSEYVGAGESVKIFLGRPARLRELVEVITETQNPALLEDFYLGAGDLVSGHHNALKRIKDARFEATRQKKKFQAPFGAEELILNPSQMAAAEEFQKATRDPLWDYLSRHPGSIFQSAVRKKAKNDPKLQQLIERDADDYATLYPQNIRELKDVLSEERYFQMVEDHFLAAFFSSDHLVGTAPEEDLKDSRSVAILDRLCQVNPLEKVARDSVKSKNDLPEDYYLLVLSELARNPFYGIYKNRLSELAATEIDLHGPLTKIPGYYEPNENFAELAKRISILNTSSEIAGHQPEITKLPAAEREELMAGLEFVLLRGLDKKGPELGKALESLSKGAGEANAIIRRMIAEHAGKMFEMPELPALVGEKTDFDSVTLRILGTYFPNAVAKNREFGKNFAPTIKEIAKGEYNWRRFWGGDPGDQSAAAKESLLGNLKAGKLIPEKISLNQYQEWASAHNADFQETLTFDHLALQRSIRDVLSQAVADHHLPPEELASDLPELQYKYQELTLPLTELTKKMADLKSQMPAKKGESKERANPELAKAYAETQAQIADYREENEGEFAELEAKLYLAVLPSMNLTMLERQLLDVGGRKVPLAKAFQAIEKFFGESHPEFTQDLRRIQGLLKDGFDRAFGKSRVSRSSLTLTDKFDLKTYLNIGEAPVPSCQSYKRPNKYNLGLLSYVSDPNVKMVQVYDKAGKIISRAALRLLGDEEGNPQLFLERVYSVNPHPKITEAIVNFAKQRAKALGAGLYSHHTENADITESGHPLKTLENRNSRASHVYTDAGGGLVKRGVFKIEDAYRIG